MRIDLKDLMQRAFLEGFLASGEGYNGEYPFDFDRQRASREIHERFLEAYANILADVEAK